MALKRTIGLILFAQSEAAYLAGGAMTGSLHTIGITEPYPVFNITYADNGDRGMGQYTRGQLPYAASSGRIAQGTVKIFGKGGTVAQLATGVPYLHSFLKASALSGSFEASAMVYKPLPVGTDPVSMCLEVYDASEVLPISGAYASMTYGSDGNKPLTFDFNIQGLCGLYTDNATPPARIFPTSGTIAPSTKNITLTIGSFTTAVVKSHKVSIASTITPRVDQNAVSGHSGFDIVLGRVTAVVTIEAPAKATFDADADNDQNTARAFSLTVGSVAGNRIQTNLPQAVLTNVKRSANGNIRELELTYEATVLAPDDNSHYSLKLF